ncbi:MAG: BatD protein [Flavobacterium sp. BFFFF2]|nr:MAG: BatD protein [Flavobacterium sp. BFFFF2]
MKQFFATCLLVLGYWTSWSQVDFDAKVSKNSLGLNEKLRIDFTMNADGDNFSPPNFESCGFRVVGGPSQSVSQSWINGRSSFNKSYTYVLMPLQKGALTIKQASIEINGQTYKTAPIKVTVTNAVEIPKDPNDAPTVRADDNLYLVADISKTSPYINEPITVVYKLYFSFNIGITNWRELNKPKYNNFWSQNIDIKQLQAEEGLYKGERYRYVVLRKTVLYPQKSGKLEIEPLSLDIDVQVPTNRRNFWGQTLLTNDSKRVSAGSRVITVKALPENGKPFDFSGAVGSFDFQAIPSRTTLQAGESLDINVKVSGTGNLKLFTLPKPVVPGSIEMYDPVHDEKVSTPLSGMTGRISDKYTLIPSYKGSYTIKPLEFSYFDLKTQRYKTLKSAPIELTILDGPGGNTTAAPIAQGNDAKSNTTINQPFAYIKQKTQLQPIATDPFMGSGRFYTFLVLPWLALPFLMIWRRKKEARSRDVVGNKMRKSSQLARKFLAEAKKNQNNKEAFYVSLERALHNFLKAKLHLETSDLSKHHISDLLQARNVDKETLDEFIRLLESCEFARYAPSSEGGIQQDYDRAEQLITNIEKQLGG